MHLTFSSVILFCFYVLHSKEIFVLLTFPVLKLRRGSTLISHKGARFFLIKKVFNVSIIMIKIKNRPISRPY